MIVLHGQRVLPTHLLEAKFALYLVLLKELLAGPAGGPPKIIPWRLGAIEISCRNLRMLLLLGDARVALDDALRLRKMQIFLSRCFIMVVQGSRPYPSHSLAFALAERLLL